MLQDDAIQYRQRPIAIIGSIPTSSVLKPQIGNDDLASD